MNPSIGRIVQYRLSASDAEQINRRRVDGGHAGVLDANGSRLWPEGAQRHVGNHASEGQVLPLIVTAVWEKEYAGNAYLAFHEAGSKYESAFGVNGQVLLDGNDSLWVTSVPQHGLLAGCWFWPERS